MKSSHVLSLTYDNVIFVQTYMCKITCSYSLLLHYKCHPLDSAEPSWAFINLAFPVWLLERPDLHQAALVQPTQQELRVCRPLYILDGVHTAEQVLDLRTKVMTCKTWRVIIFEAQILIIILTVNVSQMYVLQQIWNPIVNLVLTFITLT